MLTTIKEKASAVEGLSGQRVVAFLPLPEAGHVRPLIRIAHQVRAFGFTPVFLVGRHIAAYLRDLGLEAHSYTGPATPEKNEMAFYAPSLSSKQTWEAEWGVPIEHPSGARYVLGRLEEIVMGRRIALFVLDKSLMHLQPNLAPSLQRRSRLAVLSTAFLYHQRDLLMNRPETIVLCPGSLLSPPYRRRYSRVTYGEPSVPPSAMIVPNRVGQSSEQPLVFCGFGTQMVKFRDEVMRRMHLLSLLAAKVPSVNFLAAFPRSWLVKSSVMFRQPRNLILGHPLPQQAVLSSCSAFLTHAGLGSVKEAVLAGVPMVCWPFGLDQWLNARSVRDAGIGVMIEDPCANANTISKALDRAIRDARVRHQLSQYQALFEEREAHPIVAERLCAMAD